MTKRIVYVLIALPLAAFMAFVGWHKAFSSLADLARYGAYTVHLPDAIGRLLGWAEMTSALALVAGNHPAWRRPLPWACGFIALSQVVSSIIHVQHGETAAMPQNAVLALAALALWWIGRRAG